MNQVNSPGVVAWLLLAAVIVALSIVTVELIRDSLIHHRVKKNDAAIFKATREARRDFR